MSTRIDVHASSSDDSPRHVILLSLSLSQSFYLLYSRRVSAPKSFEVSFVNFFGHFAIIITILLRTVLILEILVRGCFTRGIV